MLIMASIPTDFTYASGLPWLAVLGGIETLDVVSTLIAFHIGLVELNPIESWFQSRLGLWWIAVKLVPIIILGAIFVNLPFVDMLMSGAAFLIVLWNAYVIIKNWPAKGAK